MKSLEQIQTEAREKAQDMIQFEDPQHLAIETAVRAELVEKVKKLDLHPTPLYSTNGNAWDYNFVHRDEVLALLTTSPSP